jgi:hypothetical protein
MGCIRGEISIIKIFYGCYCGCSGVCIKNLPDLLLKPGVLLFVD